MQNCCWFCCISWWWCIGWECWHKELELLKVRARWWDLTSSFKVLLPRQLFWEWLCLRAEFVVVPSWLQRSGIFCVASGATHNLSSSDFESHMFLLACWNIMVWMFCLVLIQAKCCLALTIEHLLYVWCSFRIIKSKYFDANNINNKKCLFPSWDLLSSATLFIRLIK